MSVDLAPVALLAHDAAFMERGSWVEVSRGAAFGRREETGERARERGREGGPVR